ncbi:MAG: hypothetical protein ACLFP8_08620 [Alphaproteobacteria bacterium]
MGVTEDFGESAVVLLMDGDTERELHLFNIAASGNANTVAIADLDGDNWPVRIGLPYPSMSVVFSEAKRNNRPPRFILVKTLGDDDVRELLVCPE